jgi:hypothetical protein
MCDNIFKNLYNYLCLLTITTSMKEIYANNTHQFWKKKYVSLSSQNDITYFIKIHRLKKPHTEPRDYSLIHGTLHPFSAEDHRIVTTGKSLYNLSVFVRLSTNLGIPDQSKLI